MSTLRDVARLAGVSKMTVSRVVNKSRSVKADTRARVESAIAQLDFVPSDAGRVLSQRRSPTRLSLPHGVLTEEVGNSNDRPTVAGGIALTPIAGRSDLFEVSSHLSGDTARTMLRIVRAAQPISRVDLARRLEVNRSTVSEIVTPLIASGVLREAAPEAAGVHRRGRPAIGLTLCGDRSFFIGVNIGVRRTQVGAATTDGGMLAEELFDTPSDSNDALRQIRSALGRLRASLPERSLVSIGVSVPGPTDATRGKLLFAPHLGWRDVPVADALLENEPGLNGVPVIVENDATAAAIYEARRRLRARTPKTQNNFILVRAGTGIGVGLVLGGEVYRGSGTDRGLLGEFGHMTILAGGDPCACGNRGCWEVYASAAGAASIYSGAEAFASGETPPRFIEIVARAREGELLAQTTLSRVGQNLGIGISNVITGLGVSRVVISGRIVHGWMFIRKSLEDAVAQTMAGRLSNWSIEAGQPTGAGLGGAVEVAIEHYLTELVRSTRAAA